MSLLRKLRKEDVFYNIVPDSQGKRCELCKNFQLVPTKDGAGTCSEVNGIISPDAYCDEFAAKIALRPTAIPAESATPLP